jgi:hypothetical protein
VKFIHTWLGSLDITEQDLQSQGLYDRQCRSDLLRHSNGPGPEPDA